MIETAKTLQKNIVKKIDEMTALNVYKLDLEVRDLVWK
jgi:uncharacterized alkaline shock family protein YloU